MPMYAANGMMGSAAGAGGAAGADDHYGSGIDESNDAKRRRIARVRPISTPLIASLEGEIDTDGRY